MRALFVAAGAVLALSGCQSAEEKRAAETGEIEASNATMQQVTDLIKLARTKTAPQPGVWHTQSRVASTDLSGLPEADRAAHMEAIKGAERNETGCRSADDLKPIDLESIEKVAGNCSIPRFIQKGGTIDVEIQCGAGADKTVVRIFGTSTATGFDITTDQVTGTKGAANYLAYVLKATGTRTASCTPGAKG